MKKERSNWTTAGSYLVHRCLRENQEREAIGMDSVPSYEFHKIFRRLSYDVDLRGAFTPEEIDRRLDAVQGYFRNRARRAVSGSEKKRLHKKARAIENLQNKNFAERTIIEARSNRYGIVNLTLNYGRKKAEEIKLAFVRAQERSRGIGRRRLP